MTHCCCLQVVYVVQGLSESDLCLAELKQYKILIWDVEASAISSTTEQLVSDFDIGFVHEAGFLRQRPRR